MSYDILFVPRQAAQSWQDALDAAESQDSLDVAVGPVRLAQWERIVAALRRRLGEVEVELAQDACEASHVSGLQVSLFPDEAAVTFPYRDRPDRDAFHDVVVDVVGLVETETGLSAWDAQTDAPFDGTVHDGAGREATRALTQEADPAATGVVTTGVVTTGVVTTGVVTTASADAPTQQSLPVPETPELALARSQALRYVVLGAVVVIGALLWQSAGAASALGGIALAVGVFDLVIGGVLWRSYLRKREQQAG